MVFNNIGLNFAPCGHPVGPFSVDRSLLANMNINVFKGFRPVSLYRATLPDDFKFNKKIAKLLII